MKLTPHKQSLKSPPRRALRAVGAVLPRVTSSTLTRQTSLAARLSLDWIEIVGPAFAACSVPRRVRLDTLVIACRGPVALEMQHVSTQLLERINRHLGPTKRSSDDRRPGDDQRIKHIKFLQDFTLPLPAEIPKPRRDVPCVPIDDAIPEGLRAVLARLGGQILARKTKVKN